MNTLLQTCVCVCGGGGTDNSECNMQRHSKNKNINMKSIELPGILLGLKSMTLLFTNNQ